MGLCYSLEDVNSFREREMSNPLAEVIIMRNVRVTLQIDLLDAMRNSLKHFGEYHNLVQREFYIVS